MRTTPADIAARSTAKKQAIDARRRLHATIQAIDVFIRSAADDAEYVAALQPFINLADLSPVTLGNPSKVRLSDG